MAGLKTSFTFEFEGEEHLRTMLSNNTGGLLLSGHLGNWEAAGHLLKRLETRVNIVMYDGEDAAIKNYLDEVTGPKNFSIITVSNDLSHIYKINEALMNNEMVCIHADRFLPGNKTTIAEFFGRPAQLPEGPFLLALKLKAPVAFVYAFKEGSSHYHLYSTPVKNYSTSGGDSVKSIAAEYTKSMEAMTLKYPYQWFNYYNFWEI
jgi:predicted LPLAT superfamily acyltransferase